jgi:hypothetical protein
VIDTRVGSAELARLAETLAPPCRLGDYTLEGLIQRTSTALIFIARGGAFGDDEGVMKLTGGEYAPLLYHELGLLNRCQAADIGGVVRPLRSELEWVEVEPIPDGTAVAILLPFLTGGDLVQWIGAHATRTGRLGPRLALDVGVHVGGVLRDLLHMPRPMVHCDVKPQNVLLPYPDAPLTELKLIDLDASEELEESATNSRRKAELLIKDVHGYGELLFVVATGRDPPTEGLPDPRTGNHAFDALVVNCLTSESDGPGYSCLADRRLWQDLETARLAERTRKRVAKQALSGRLPYLLNRWSLAGAGVVLFVGLVAAVVSKVGVG